MASKEDNRSSSRLPLHAEIELADGTQGGELFFESENISEGGLFLKSELLLEVGETFWVSFRLPGSTAPIRTRGQVVWVNRHPDPANPSDQPGMGIQFIDLSDLEKAALDAFLQSLEPTS